MAVVDQSIKPFKGLQYEFSFPIFDSTGTLVSGATSLDSEISKDGGAFVDCTNETTEIGTSGMYELTLTATEMDANMVSLIIKSNQDTTPIVLYPSTEVIDRGNAQAGGGSSEIVLRATPRLAAGNDFFNGMIVRIIDGTGEGQMRIIEDYVHSSVTCTVDRAWGNNPDATSVYEIVLDNITTFDSTGAGLTAIPWNASWDTEVQSECNDALIALGLDHLISFQGTADSGTSSTLVDAALTEANADHWKDSTLVLVSGTNAGFAALITDFVPGTDTITFAPNSPVAVGTENYVILPKGRVDLQQWKGATPQNLTAAGMVDANVEEVNETTVTGDGGAGTEWGPV